MRRFALAVLLPAVILAGCGGGDEGTVSTASGSGFTFAQGDVRPAEAIDPRFTCEGDDVSPFLTWQGTPTEAQELALLLEDPDAPGRTLTHWLAYRIPSGSVRVPQAIPSATQIPGPTPLFQGRNDLGEVGYAGPCPPHGETHTYVFRLLALDTKLGLPAGTDRATFDAAAKGHVIAEARLTAPFSRD